MKEATGELSMTAIVVVILAVLAVVAPIIVRTVGNTMKMRAACQASYGCTTCQNGTQTCKYLPDNCTTASCEEEITCSCGDNATQVK